MLAPTNLNPTNPGEPSDSCLRALPDGRPTSTNDPRACRSTQRKPLGPLCSPCPSPSPDFETPLVASVRFTSLSIAGCQNLHPAGYGLTLRVNYNRTDLNVSSSTRRPSTSPSTDLAVAARRPTDFGLCRRCRVPSSSSADFADVPRCRPGLQPFRLCSTTRLHRRRTRASCRLVT